MTKLHDDDDGKRLVEVLSDGNLEAAAALLTLLENAFQEKAEKGTVLLGVTRFFDEWGMYGKDVAVVLNDLCEGDPLRFIMLFSSVQSGFFPLEKLKLLCSDHSGNAKIKQFEWAAISMMVQVRLKELRTKGEPNENQVDKH